MVRLKVSQKVVGVSAAEFQSSSILRGAFVASVCWSLRPFPDCKNVNITKIVDVSFSSSLASSLEQRDLQITWLTQIKYDLFFYDNFIDGGSNNPGEEKRTLLSGSVSDGSFAATFAQRVALMATAAAAANDPEAAAALTAVQGIQFTNPSVGSPSFDTFVPKVTDAPTLDPTASPTLGLGLQLQRGQLVAAFVIILGVVGAACAPSIGWYCWRRHVRVARRVKNQEAVNAAMQQMRKAAAVSPEPPDLSLEQLQFGEDGEGEEDLEEEEEDEEGEEEEERTIVLPVQKEEEKSEPILDGAATEIRLPESAPLRMPPAKAATAHSQRAASASAQLFYGSSDDDDDDGFVIRFARKSALAAVKPSTPGDVRLSILRDLDSDSDDGLRLEVLRLTMPRGQQMK